MPSENTRIENPNSKKGLLLKVFLGIVSLVVIIVLVAFFLGPQIFTYSFIKIKFPESYRPELYTSVLPRSLSKTSLQAQKHYSHLGVSFSVPWKNETTNKTVKNVLAISFEDNKKTILVLKSLTNLKNELMTGKPEDAKNMEFFYGDENLKTDYSYRKMLYNANPKNMSIFESKKKAIADNILFILKAAIITDHTKGGIFSIETNQFNAIQLGDPKLSDGIEVLVFDNNDNSYSFIFRKGITQDEIDFILSSIKFTK